MENLSEHDVRLRIVPLGKLGRFKSTAENFSCLRFFNQPTEWADPKSYLPFAKGLYGKSHFSSWGQPKPEAEATPCRPKDLLPINSVWREREREKMSNKSDQIDRQFKRHYIWILMRFWKKRRFAFLPLSFLGKIRKTQVHWDLNEKLKSCIKKWISYTVKLGYNEQLGTGHFCSL